MNRCGGEEGFLFPVEAIFAGQIAVRPGGLDQDRGQGLFAWNSRFFHFRDYISRIVKKTLASYADTGLDLPVRGSRCSRCYSCVPACPRKAISKAPKKRPVIVDRAKCDLCVKGAKVSMFEALVMAVQQIRSFMNRSEL